jgi:sugar phosphate isomerase/epimerase
MRLGYSLGNHSARFGAGVGFEAHLRGAVAAGFTRVEVDDWTFAAGELGADPARLAAVLAACGARCATFGPLRVTGAGATGTAMDALEPVLHAVRPEWMPAVVHEAGPATVATVRRCADRAHAAGCGLAIEFMTWTPVATLADARALAAAVGRPSVKVLVDAFHVGCGAATWPELASLTAGEIAMVQLSDVRLPAGDDHRDHQRASSHGRLLPGAGDLDLDRLGRLLAATGWDGLVSLEVLSDDLRARPPAQSTAAAWRHGTATLARWPAARDA